MNELILTSFRDVSSWPSSTVWSVARWQPGYIGRPELPWLAPFDVETGRPLVHLMPADYRLKYETVLDLAESKLRAIPIRPRRADYILLLVPSRSAARLPVPLLPYHPDRLPSRAPAAQHPRSLRRRER